MKFVWPAFLLINSVAAFARPFPFWGRSLSSATSEAAATASTVVVGREQDRTTTCLQATTPTAAVDSKPAVVDAGNWELLSARGQAALAHLIQADEGFDAQTHVYGDWPPVGTEDEGKKRLAEQVGDAALRSYFYSADTFHATVSHHYHVVVYSFPSLFLSLSCLLSIAR